MASENGIQLRSKNKNSGIVVTTSGGIIDAIGVVWNSSTTMDRTLQIYASNEPFTVADMYNGKDGLVKVGEIDNSSDIAIFDDFEEEYAYVGVRMASGAGWFDKIVFSWTPQE